jgi:hypothetical protein
MRILFVVSNSALIRFTWAPRSSLWWYFSDIRNLHIRCSVLRVWPTPKTFRPSSQFHPQVRIWTITVFSSRTIPTAKNHSTKVSHINVQNSKFPTNCDPQTRPKFDTQRQNFQKLLSFLNNRRNFTLHIFFSSTWNFSRLLSHFFFQTECVFASCIHNYIVLFLSI